MIQQLKTARQLLAGPVRGWMTLAIAGSVFIAGLDLLGVAAMLPLMQLVTGADPTVGAAGRVSDLIGRTDSRSVIIAVASIIAAAFVLKGIFSIGFRWWLLGRTTTMEAEASTELLRRYAASPYWAHRRRPLSVINRSIGLSTAQTFSQVVLGLISLFADVLTLVAVGLILLATAPSATVFIVALFGLISWSLQHSLRHRQTEIGEVMAASDLEAWNAFMPAVHGFREARLTSSASTFVERYHRARVRRAHVQRQQALFGELPKYVLELGLVVGIVGITLILFATEDQDTALATLGVFVAASFRVLPTLNRAVATVGVIRTGRVGVELLAAEVVALDALGYYDGDHRPAPSYDGAIVLDEVSYHYHDAVHHVLENVTTTIEHGRTTAIVGASGAGKTTLLDLLLGLLEPTSGEIRCGGRSIYEDLPGWYAGLGVVPQDVFIVDESLANNIGYGEKPDQVDEVRVHEAIELAELEELEAELPEGIRTRLGERGVRLSGGQRQRVGIARALYGAPRILVLDEATSALDNETERKISDTIERLSGTMTVVIVAHRLSTVRNADKVVFMSAGRVVAEGTFEEVRHHSPEFARLVALGKLE